VQGASEGFDEDGGVVVDRWRHKIELRLVGDQAFAEPAAGVTTEPGLQTRRNDSTSQVPAEGIASRGA
jgi:hypothetical protein